jgi:hypothetical protein
MGHALAAKVCGVPAERAARTIVAAGAGHMEPVGMSCARQRYRYRDEQATNERQVAGAG